MAEELKLTTPVAYPSCIGYCVDRVDLNWRDTVIHIELRGTNNEKLEYEYRGEVATNLMLGLNTANLSVKSLHRRILERLVADGVLDGIVSGSPN